MPGERHFGLSSGDAPSGSHDAFLEQDPDQIARMFQLDVGAVADVVTATRKALEQHRTPPSVITGPGNRMSARTAQLAPRRLTLRLAGRALKA
ncbi:hypothetical protein ABT278_37285 [Streptomyces sp. NPDC001228]|uniref:hypothetical protein n=1 Tax=Streptomyces sp. NPDC001228 TaxID=3154381 RepID=UPI003330F221